MIKEYEQQMQSDNLNALIDVIDEQDSNDNDADQSYVDLDYFT